jgi:hypothetical protein
MGYLDCLYAGVLFYIVQRKCAMNTNKKMKIFILSLHFFGSFRYVHSYQSYLWNNAASTRVQKYGKLRFIMIFFILDLTSFLWQLISNVAPPDILIAFNAIFMQSSPRSIIIMVVGVKRFFIKLNSTLLCGRNWASHIRRLGIL